MTCVLSIPALYTEDGLEIRKNRCESFDLKWINGQNVHGLSDNQRCATRCHIELGKCSSTACRLQISSRHSGNVNHGVNVHTQNLEAGLESADTEKHFLLKGKQYVPNLFDTSNKTDVFPDYIKNHGVKRKAESELEEAYIPHKRVSPFLNTPKERKDERKKIMKISVEKIKQLDNPETFLRRSVLVNNTMKRLQTELRQEKRRTKKFTSNNRTPFCGYDVTPNNCMSDTYLYDDPFLSGIHEKITDDMTDTLINNVFHNKTDDKSIELNISETSDRRQNEHVVTEKQVCTGSIPFILLSDKIPCAKNNTVIECNNLTCVDTQEMSIDMCISNICEENTRTICYNDSETVNVGESDSQ